MENAHKISQIWIKLAWKMKKKYPKLIFIYYSLNFFDDLSNKNKKNLKIMKCVQYNFFIIIKKSLHNNIKVCLIQKELTIYLKLIGTFINHAFHFLSIFYQITRDSITKHVDNFLRLLLAINFFFDISGHINLNYPELENDN